jgi:predicted membrane chloride channel (bestrophin family)
MSRQYAAFFPKDAARAAKRAFMQRWITAFVYSLKCHLRERGNLQDHLQGVLPPHELQALLDSTHHPIYTLQCLVAGIAGSGVSDILKSKMDEELTAMEDCVGGCERLLRTPIPLSYTRQTSGFLARPPPSPT